MEIIHRTSCRAILLTPDNEVLLIKIENPSGSWSGWITPGGGIDDGEDEIRALRRELSEELGFEDFFGEIKIWKRFHQFFWSGKSVAQHEVFYLIRTPRFDPAPHSNLTETEMLEFKGFRWWRLDELKSSAEEFAPRSLCKYLYEIVSKGVPPEPIDVGI